MANSKRFILWTDGACKKNPGPGGWAYILKSENAEHVDSGGEKDTTNQRMEITAALRGLQSIEEPAIVEVWSDSKYVTDGIEKWLEGWLQNGWKNAKKKPVANKDLWELIAEEVKRHTISTHWIEGRTGHPENERCDSLASNEAKQVLAT